MSKPAPPTKLTSGHPKDPSLWVVHWAFLVLIAIFLLGTPDITFGGGKGGHQYEKPGGKYQIHDSEALKHARNRLKPIEDPHLPSIGSEEWKKTIFEVMGKPTPPIEPPRKPDGRYALPLPNLGSPESEQPARKIHQATEKAVSEHFQLVTTFDRGEDGSFQTFKSFQKLRHKEAVTDAIDTAIYYEAQSVQNQNGNALNIEGVKQSLTRLNTVLHQNDIPSVSRVLKGSGANLANIESITVHTDKILTKSVVDVKLKPFLGQPDLYKGRVNLDDVLEKINMDMTEFFMRQH